jgi:DNA-directed RNA polymerase subunit RPC12/RpoP
MRNQDDDIPAAQWSRCPTCGRIFGQSQTGRRGVYCSRACQQKEFRHAKSVTKLNPAARQELVRCQKSVGRWQLLNSFPAWPSYRCLACARPILADSAATVDRFSWDQCAGVYRRLICAQCNSQELV